MMYDELKFHLFITYLEYMDRVYTTHRKVWIKFQLSKERTKGSEHKDKWLKVAFSGY